jgi:TPR repeat protein
MNRYSALAASAQISVASEDRRIRLELPIESPMKRFLMPLAIMLLLCACSKKDAPMPQTGDLSALRANLAFSCTHEASRLPALNPDADKLLLYARYLQKQEGQRDFDDIMRYYRIAAAYGHYKANHNAQLLIVQGLVLSPKGKEEAVDLAMQLMHNGIPGGYYDVGHYLEVGYGVQQDTEAAMHYIRKAADLGNPEAQAYIAAQLNPVSMAPEIARQMWHCAAEQGDGDAANRLGIALKVNGDFAGALSAFQLGVKAGEVQAAYSLERGFDGPSPADRISYLGLSKDAERSRRYGLIREFISRNDGRNPTVPDIEKIVPLPPAPLPAWDGSFQWEKEQTAAKAPEKPSDDLVNRLAKDKHLDPATGLPLADAPSKTSEIEQTRPGRGADEPIAARLSRAHRRQMPRRRRLVREPRCSPSCERATALL